MGIFYLSRLGFFLCRNPSYCKNLTFNKNQRLEKASETLLLPFAGWGRQCGSLVPLVVSPSVSLFLQLPPQLPPALFAPHPENQKQKKTTQKVLEDFRGALQSSGVGLLRLPPAADLQGSSNISKSLKPRELSFASLLFSPFA